MAQIELQTLFKREGTADSIHNSGVAFVPKVQNNMRRAWRTGTANLVDLKMAGLKTERKF
jgi:hypothetical protein